MSTEKIGTLRKYNYKNGAVIGAGASLTSVGLEYIFNPEFQQLVQKDSLEEVIGGIILASASVAIPCSVTGYINQKFIIPIFDRISDKIDKKIEVYSKS
ncbi:MAG: hypothetical protein AABX49_01730 [Nanoarchaeota archaeon]